MDSKEIFAFGLPVVFGFSLFIYWYSFEQGRNVYKEYFAILGLAFLGLIFHVLFVIYLLGYTFNEAISGSISYIHLTPHIACYTIIVFILLSITSDAIYPLIKPLIEKIKENKQKKKFRTPKIK